MSLFRAEYEDRQDLMEEEMKIIEESAKQSMDINDKKPEDVLKPEFVQQYKELHEDIWHQLVETNTTITILEKIQSFPFHHFYSPNENVFWNMVYWNFTYTLVVLMYALVNDERKDRLTILKFRDFLSKDWLKDNEKQEFYKRAGKFNSANIKQVCDKIDVMRHKIIAHRIMNPDCTLPEVTGVTLLEIKKIFKEIETLFQACCFGSEYITSLYLNGTCGGKPIERDIDHILDLIVKDSYWLNKPERRPLAWDTIKKTKSSEEILELNQWRKKFGMIEV